MTWTWKNPEAARKFAELVQRGDGMTAVEMGELLALEGHNVTIEGPMVTVCPATPAPDARVSITATYKGNPGDVLP